MTEWLIVLCAFGGVAFLAWVLWLIIPSPQCGLPKIEQDCWFVTPATNDLDRIIAHEIEEQFNEVKR